MKYLFIHQNMPGQFKYIARRLAQDKNNQVVFITKRKDIEIPNVKKVLYAPHRDITKGLHHYLVTAERGILHGQQVVRKALELRNSGFTPDVIVGHPGWGEMLYLKEVFPDVPVLAFFEFYYQTRGSDIGFDPSPSEQPTLDHLCRIRTKNVVNFMSLEMADAGLSPTLWQYEQTPKEFRYKVSVIFDGVDVNAAKPDPEVTLTTPVTNVQLSRKDKVVTYVVRNFEPYRGFPTYMRALEILCKRHPDTHFILVGADGVSYGKPSPSGKPYRQEMLEQVNIDKDRVHFVGQVPYGVFLKILQISRCHVYLTYPFVLSWSLMEALSSGCVVVGSRTAPVEEMITDGVNGLLVDFFDHQAVADKVSEVLEAPDGMADLGVRARQFVVDNYALEDCIARQFELIDHLVSGRRPRPPEMGHPHGKPVFVTPEADRPLFPRTNQETPGWGAKFRLDDPQPPRPVVSQQALAQKALAQQQRQGGQPAARPAPNRKKKRKK